MKRLFSFTILLVVLMNMIPTKLLASIEIKNGDGVTIYYKFINDNTELSVTYRGNSWDTYRNEYRGNIVIPGSVEYDGTTYQVTSIGTGAFCECNLLESVTIPNSVTSIDVAAFEWCTGITSITFPNSVTSIGSYAFHGCSRLASVIIPNSVTSIGGCVFIGCKNLKSIDIPNSVTKIGDYTFQECGLTSVTLPNKITSIDTGLFQNSRDLTSVTIPNSVTSIKASAFAGCSGLTSISIPDDVTNIGKNAFQGCKNLTSVNIPDGVTSIDIGVFENCSALTSFPIGIGVTSIGDEAFSGCSGLTSVSIPARVTTIGDESFNGCNNMTSVTIGDGVTTIGESAFGGCSKLMFVFIGAQVATIGRYALSCSSVIEIDSKAQTPPVCGTQALGSINKSECKLFVPDNCLAAYQVADQWKDFTLMEEGAGTGGQCAKPTISYQGSKLKFTCQTEGVSFCYNVTTSPSEGEGEEFSLLKSYTVTVYAKKEGYKDSEPAIEVVEIPEPNGDMNNDGIITITDAMILIDGILMNK